MKVLILAANSRIAQIVTTRLLSEGRFDNVILTLGVRHHDRLAKLDSKRVHVVEADLRDLTSLNKVLVGQNLVFVATVDYSRNSQVTQNVIAAMQANQVSRVIFSNILGIYDEVPGAFGKWNHEQALVQPYLASGRNSDRLLRDSGLVYTTLRLPWLNDHNEINYQITTKGEPYIGTSVSRRSISDVVLKIIADPDFAANDSIGIGDPDTQGLRRPVL
ncbi:NAD(P)H-binding protein [Levilactobacillus hammesii]|uniref:Saccharopine dehydrogenase related protein n=1 Tax=Levilactobacillus hammesii DSM 16381 TaxID=1423753 RepID=A0A0R1UWF6_9LACO|nr:NAD(P)H-binding protein [Levilactobacillus hammesii]KRL97577.1 saccharopine dehydrogenase related protein [Levilactobacillus hammesii DSM 16381]